MINEARDTDEIASWLWLCDVVDKFWYAVRVNKFNHFIQSEHIQTGIKIAEKKKQINNNSNETGTSH